MASSSYYYNRYQEYKKKEKKYDGWYKQLKEMELSFMGAWSWMRYSEVNKCVGRCASNSRFALDGDYMFASNSALLEETKERATSDDASVSVAISSIKNEKERVRRLRDEARDTKEEYYRKYKSAKRREAAERAARAAAAAAGG